MQLWLYLTWEFPHTSFLRKDQRKFGTSKDQAINMLVMDHLFNDPNEQIAGLIFKNTQFNF